MQIAIFVGPRPRPPSYDGKPLFPSLPLSFFPILSSGGIAAGAKITRNQLQPTCQVRGLLLAYASVAAVGVSIWNSIGAALPRRWVVRACRDGL